MEFKAGQDYQKFAGDQKKGINLGVLLIPIVLGIGLWSIFSQDNQVNKVVQPKTQKVEKIIRSKIQKIEKSEAFELVDQRKKTIEIQTGFFQKNTEKVDRLPQSRFGQRFVDHTH
jgi:hypothetical protein